MAGVSGRALAKLLGISEGAVRKIRDTCLAEAKLPGGLFDPERARALYAANVDKAMQQERPSTHAATSSPAPAAGPAVVMGRPEAAGPDVNKARAAWTMEKACREQIKRKVDEKSVIERAPAFTLVQAQAREFRAGLFRFPDKHAAKMAAELGVDENALYECLQKHFRAYLEKDIARMNAEVLGCPPHIREVVVGIDEVGVELDGREIELRGVYRDVDPGHDVIVGPRRETDEPPKIE